MNEKLYAIGGYDGTQMVPTVEVFEPRVGSWMMLEPMKYARGYMGSVTLGNTIYVIGGMQENGEILDTVECYSEGKGWKLADLKAFGKRCFFSAVAV
ncbi:Influenza virus NS1A-binding protein [Bienertia sinuspersici]